MTTPSTIVALSDQPAHFNADLSPLLAQIYDGVFEYLQTVNYRSLLVDIKTVAIILSIVFGAIFVWIVFFKIRELYQPNLKEVLAGVNPPPEAPTAYSARWEEIKQHANSFVEAEWKLAVVEADKFVDDVLKTAGFVGESMGERLMLIKPDQIINLQYLWDAHKLRNLLVHDPNFRLTHQQALFAINAFESVLKELSALT